MVITEQLDGHLNEIWTQYVEPTLTPGHGREQPFNMVSTYIQSRTMLLQLKVMEEQNKHNRNLVRWTRWLVVATVLLAIVAAPQALNAIRTLLSGSTG